MSSATDGMGGMVFSLMLAKGWVCKQDLCTKESLFLYSENKNKKWKKRREDVSFIDS